MITDWHPLIIHFPIALISTSVAFDCLHFILKRDDLLSASWWTMFFGLISSLAAVASGIIDDSLIGHFGAVWPLWQNHGAMQIFTIISQWQIIDSRSIRNICSSIKFIVFC